MIPSEEKPLEWKQLVLNKQNDLALFRGKICSPAVRSLPAFVFFDNSRPNIQHLITV